MTIRPLIGSLLALMAVLGGCKDKTSQTLDLAVIGEKGDPFETGLRLSIGGQLVRGATAEGLVGLDEVGRVVPGLADRWIVTSDGLSYIFRLRDGVWADGSSLTAEGARDALRQAMAGLRGTALGEDLAAIEEIRVMAGRVVELRLRHPFPDMLNLVAQPELALLRRGRPIGAMLIRRDAGGNALLQPQPPERLGMPAIKDWADRVRPVRLFASDAAAAVARFEKSQVSAVMGGRFSDYALAVPAAGLSRRALRIDPVVGLFGLVFTNESGLLSSPEAREALALAIDRELLANDLGITAWQPTSRIVPATVADAPQGIAERWAGMDQTQRRTLAASRLARWKVRGGTGPVLRLALPAGPGADALWNRVHDDLAALGVTVQRVQDGAPADMRLVDAVARYGRADWFLTQLSCAVLRGPCSPTADALVATAQSAPNAAARNEALAQAEQALTLANVYVPLGNPIRWSLVREPLPGFAVNAWGWHPLPSLSLPPK